MNNLWIVDTFTSVPFSGNPAAVYLLEEFFDDKRLQLLAARANLSETAFVVKVAPLKFNLRWFTPTMEVSLCGHATMAAAHVLLQTGEVKTGDVISFNTLSGELGARILKNGRIELNFPLLEGQEVKPDPALSALGAEFTACQKNRDDFLVEVKDFATLLAIKPNMKKLAKLSARGVIVTTSQAVDGFDFASRFFAPGIGVDEDPVTGSAHCFLAPYWQKKLNKDSFHALQASRSRGVLDIVIEGNRVLISGNCITTLKDMINFPRQKSRKDIFA